jgi:molybdopterin-guanine dinucleotide biosynthesis protein
VRQVVIGGARSGAGKTALACRLLPRLPGWGAIKLSRVDPGGEHGLAADHEIRIAPTVLERPGSDTTRLAKAGAAAVVWVVAERAAVARALPGALQALGPVLGVLVEGNSASLALPEAPVLFAVPASDLVLKPGAAFVLSRARWVIVTGPASALKAGLAPWREELSGDRSHRLRALALDEEDDPPWLAEIAATLREGP